MHHGEKGTIITPGRPDGDLRADTFRCSNGCRYAIIQGCIPVPVVAGTIDRRCCVLSQPFSRIQRQTASCYGTLADVFDCHNLTCTLAALCIPAQPSR
jgi:hypothetical protein